MVLRPDVQIAVVNDYMFSHLYVPVPHPNEGDLGRQRGGLGFARQTSPVAPGSGEVTARSLGAALENRVASRPVGSEA